MAEAHMTRLLYLPLAQGGELATRVSLDLAACERAAHNFEPVGKFADFSAERRDHRRRA